VRFGWTSAVYLLLAEKLLYRFSIAYTGQQLVCGKEGGNRRGRARIIADKTKKSQRQSALSASSAFY
jgi:hypothetical protein